jgi:hypothetical protein
VPPAAPGDVYGFHALHEVGILVAGVVQKSLRVCAGTWFNIDSRFNTVATTNLDTPVLHLGAPDKSVTEPASPKQTAEVCTTDLSTVGRTTPERRRQMKDLYRRV